MSDKKVSDKKVTMEAMSNVFDTSRGVSFYKGTYVEASPEFFKKYGPLFKTPKVPYDDKKHVKKTVQWDKLKKFFEPTTTSPKAVRKPAIAGATLVNETKPEVPTKDEEPKKRPGMSTGEAAVPEDTKPEVPNVPEGSDAPDAPEVPAETEEEAPKPAPKPAPKRRRRKKPALGGAKKKPRPKKEVS